MTGVRDQCDLWRHAWFPVDADWTPPFQGDIETARCERCGSERREIWQPHTGALLYRRYVHTVGWVKYKRDERPSMDQLRRAWIAGAIIQAREARLKAVRNTSRSTA